MTRYRAVAPVAACVALVKLVFATLSVRSAVTATVGELQPPRAGIL
jgi:hypothetical protein